MPLKNKLNIIHQVELNKVEEKITKQKIRELFDTDGINKIEVGTFKGLAEIHSFLFCDLYDFAGQIRDVNISKAHFRFIPVIYLQKALESIEKMSQNNFDEIIEKYVEMNIAHPFREGNGRTTRIWLDLILKKEIKKVIDWNLVSKEKYLFAMEQSVMDSREIKELLKSALTDKINEREIFMKGVDVSYYYEGYSEFKIDEV